ncbi:hypothetical protein D3C81_1839110 [compost metagenome]
MLSISGFMAFSMNDTPVNSFTSMSAAINPTPTAAKARLAPPVKAAPTTLTTVSTAPRILPIHPIALLAASALRTCSRYSSDFFSMNA